MKTGADAGASSGWSLVEPGDRSAFGGMAAVPVPPRREGNNATESPAVLERSREWEICLKLWEQIAPLGIDTPDRVAEVRQNEAYVDLSRAWWWRVVQHHGNMRKIMGGKLSEQQEATLATILLEKIPLRHLGVDNKRDTGAMVLTVPQLARRVGYVSPGGKYLGTVVLDELGDPAPAALSTEPSAAALSPETKESNSSTQPS